MSRRKQLNMRGRGYAYTHLNPLDGLTGNYFATSPSR